MRILKKDKGKVFIAILFISWSLLVAFPKIGSLYWREWLADYPLTMEILVYDTHMRQYWEYAISTPEIPQELIEGLLLLTQLFLVLQHPLYVSLSIILMATLFISLIIRYVLEMSEKGRNNAESRG